MDQEHEPHAGRAPRELENTLRAGQRGPQLATRIRPVDGLHDDQALAHCEHVPEGVADDPH
eukprot:3440872-Prymnesium_polylepis.1